MGDEGGQAICKALLENNSLKTINLASNNMTEPVAAILSQVLQSNAALCSINLSGNKIGQVSLGVLATALNFSHKYQSYF